MGTLCYYVAASIDGFIAKEDDSLDWLNHIPQHNSFEMVVKKIFLSITTSTKLWM